MRLVRRPISSHDSSIFWGMRLLADFAFLIVLPLVDHGLPKIRSDHRLRIQHFDCRAQKPACSPRGLGSLSEDWWPLSNVHAGRGGLISAMFVGAFLFAGVAWPSPSPSQGGPGCFTRSTAQPSVESGSGRRSAAAVPAGRLLWSLHPMEQKSSIVVHVRGKGAVSVRFIRRYFFATPMSCSS